MKSFLLKAFSLALIADQEYAQAQTAGRASLLQPGNVEALMGELAAVLSQNTPAAS